MKGANAGHGVAVVHVVLRAPCTLWYCQAHFIDFDFSTDRLLLVLEVIERRPLHLVGGTPLGGPDADGGVVEDYFLPTAVDLKPIKMSW